MTGADQASGLRIYVDLIGDLFHPGHVNLLKNARALGDKLIVGVLSDDEARALGRPPVMNLDERVAVIAACRFVDEIVAGVGRAIEPALLDKHAIRYACLVNDFGDQARRKSFRDLIDSGRAIVLPYRDPISTGDIVARITGILEAAPGRNPTDLPVRHDRPPPGGGGDAMKSLAELARGQAVALDTLGAIAAAVLNQRWLLPSRQVSDDVWVNLLRCQVGEKLDIDVSHPDRPRETAALLSLVRRGIGSGMDVVLLGGQAIGLGYALAAQRQHHVSVLIAGLSHGLAMPGESARSDPAPDIIACLWHELPWACPISDALAIIDEKHGSQLLADRSMLRELSSRVKDSLVLVAEMSPEPAQKRLPRDGNRFVHTDSYIRGRLHDAGFFEIADLATIVDGVPRDPIEAPARISRYSEREKLSHGDGFRFLDGRPIEPIDVPVDSAKVLRWYRARKGLLSAQDRNGGDDARSK